MRSFLGCCRNEWGPKELRAVQRKLAAVGVDDVPELLKRVRDGSLNDSLERAGERRFTSETLESMRCVGVQRASPSWLRGSDRVLEESSSGEEECEQKQANQAPAYDFDLLDPSSFFADDLEESYGQFRCDGQTPKRSLGRWMRSRKLDPYDEEASLRQQQASLRQQIFLGLSQVEAVSAEARRRNFEVTRCLAEVQADIARITERMCAARQRRDRGSTYHDMSQVGTSSVYSRTPVGKARMRPSSIPTPHSETPGPSPWPRRPGSEARRSQPSELRGGVQSRRAASVVGGGGGTGLGAASRAPREASSTRGMQSGFTFGGNAPKRPARAPPLEVRKTTSYPADPTAQAQEAVRQQLLSVLDRSEVDKRAFVKRLLVKWHPDRNPESIEVATTVFQYIQQEKQQLLGL